MPRRAQDRIEPAPTGAHALLAPWGQSLSTHCSPPPPGTHAHSLSPNKTPTQGAWQQRSTRATGHLDCDEHVGPESGLVQPPHRRRPARPLGPPRAPLLVPGSPTPPRRRLRRALAAGGGPEEVAAASMAGGWAALGVQGAPLEPLALGRRQGLGPVPRPATLVVLVQGPAQPAAAEGKLVAQPDPHPVWRRRGRWLLVNGLCSRAVVWWLTYTGTSASKAYWASATGSTRGSAHSGNQKCLHHSFEEVPRATWKSRWAL